MSIRRTQPKTNQATLYMVVFGSIYVKCAVALLFAFMLLQPIATVYADETTSDNEAVAENVTEETEKAPAEPEAAEETAATEVAEEAVEAPESEAADTAGASTESETLTSPSTADVSDPVSSNEAVSTAQSTTTPPATTSTTSTAPVAPTATSTPAVPAHNAGGDSGAATTTTATTTPVGIPTATSSVPAAEWATSTPEFPVVTEPESVPVETPQATSTEPGAEVEPESPAEEMVSAEESETAATTTENVVYVINESVNDSNRYQFGVNECVSVGDGSFYCNKTNISGITEEADGVFAEPDNDGDKEIFLRSNGSTMQITHNQADDASPYFDQAAEQILWHRLINGRYQIIRYDLDTESEEQLTDTNQNNMEPTQADGVAVWQTWSNNNWEIALLENDEIKVISDNTYHDVAPQVRNGYVLWHTTNEAGDKLLSVYELATGETSSIADPDGGHVENPRFVLVYDTKFENGDTITKEYDPKTGTVRPLSGMPAPATPQLPSPEPTGETTALVNAKTSSKDENLLTLDDFNPTPVGTSTATSSPDLTDTSAGPPNASSSVPVTPTLDLSSTSTEPLPLTEFDLIIEPFSGSSSAQQSSSASTTAGVE